MLTGWTLRDVLDLLVKLSPAITIVFGLAAAQVQWKRQQRLNAELIAKNHYREMLEQLLRNADLLGRGATPERFRELQADPVEYRRFVLLFAVVAFALQEIYFATDPKKNRHWGGVIKLFFEPFGPLMATHDAFTPSMSTAVSPEFSAYVESLFPDHPAGHTVAQATGRAT